MQKNYNKKENHDVRFSKDMSWLLRHGAVQEGLKIRPDGYVALLQVITYLEKRKGYKNIEFKKIQALVEDNDKQRFQLDKFVNPDTEQKEWYIRATQGHSMKEVKTEQLLQIIEDPKAYPVVIHGTYEKFWPFIEKEGLKRMTRLHIHFAPGYPKQEGVISGMRSSCDVYIEIDMAAAMQDGIPFYISNNNVILTEGIDGVLPPKYFKNVVHNKK